MNIEDIKMRIGSLKNTIESMEKPILPLKKELEGLEKLTKIKNEKVVK